MDHFAGLDVSVKETSVCILDNTGRIVREVKVASEAEALLPVLTNPLYCFKRLGLEAGPLSQWLFSALAEAGVPVICVETRHIRAVLGKREPNCVCPASVDGQREGRGLLDRSQPTAAGVRMLWGTPKIRPQRNGKRYSVLTASTRADWR
jgi:hypothetical protein